MPWMRATPATDQQEELKFTLGKALGHGSFGQVFQAQDAITGDELAVKVEQPVGKCSTLAFEARVLKRLVGAHGFPKVHSLGKEGGYHLLAMELLGPSMEAVYNKCGRKFSLRTLLMLADQMVRRLEYLHLKGYVHRDIKPENFLIGRGGRRNVIYLIDFGLTKKLDLAKPRLGARRSLAGTARYASISAHEGAEQGGKDDLEALAYVLIYFNLGKLPWQGLRAETKEEKHEKIKEMKLQIPVEELCNGCHVVFAKFLQYTQGLAFQEIPDYNYIYELFSSAMLSEGFKEEGQFDWQALPEKTESASKMSSAKQNVPEQGSYRHRSEGLKLKGERESRPVKRQVTPPLSVKTLCTSTRASSGDQTKPALKRGFLLSLFGCVSAPERA